MWVDAFAPKNSGEIMGNATAVKEIKTWVCSTSPNKPPVLLVHGEPGIGKTASCTVILKEYGYDTVECNASVTRTKDDVNSVVDTLFGGGRFSTSRNPFIVKRKRALIMDEIDGLHGSSERGGFEAVLAAVNRLSRVDPGRRSLFVCICNDFRRVKEKAHALTQKAKVVKMWPPWPNDVAKLVDRICSLSGMSLEPLARVYLSQRHKDLRNLVSAMQFLSMGKKPVYTLEDVSLCGEKNQFHDLYGGFKAMAGGTKGVGDIVEIARSENELYPNMVHQNIPTLCAAHVPKGSHKLSALERELEMMERVAGSCRWASDGELLHSALKREQNWGLQSAALATSVAGVIKCADGYAEPQRRAFAPSGGGGTQMDIKPPGKMSVPKSVSGYIVDANADAIRSKVTTSRTGFPEVVELFGKHELDSIKSNWDAKGIPLPPVPLSEQPGRVLKDWEVWVKYYDVWQPFSDEGRKLQKEMGVVAKDIQKTNDTENKRIKKAEGDEKKRVEKERKKAEKELEKMAKKEATALAKAAATKKKKTTK
jgi:hypothetical protein